jgi:hypothetical protein
MALEKGFRTGKRDPNGAFVVYRRGEIDQVARVLRILEALRGFKHGRTRAELATEVGVSERTVRRDSINLIDAEFASSTRIDGRADAVLLDASTSVVIAKSERYLLLAVRRDLRRDARYALRASC